MKNEEERRKFKAKRISNEEVTSKNSETGYQSQYLRTTEDQLRTADWQTVLA
jgi:hypothetical protein